jgi:hypothetical protein
MRSISNIHYGVYNSRRLLIQTIQALQPFQNALTIVGAHAVHVWATDAWGAIDMQATRDADIAINPVFVSDEPKVLELLEGINISPALKDRPGIYGFDSERDFDWAARTTVDLIVPETYAGKGRRSAHIPGQNRATTRAVGLELALWDRHLIKLSTFDDPTILVDTYVSGPAALLIAKSHKIHERLLAITSRPDRLRPKDSGDVALLMMVSDAKEIAQTMATECALHPEISEVVCSGATWLIEMYGIDTSEILPRQHAVSSLAERFDDNEVLTNLNNWVTTFQAEAQKHFLIE